MGRLAVDIGGTFTDLVLFDDQTGDLTAEKSLTTPKDLTKGIQNDFFSCKKKLLNDSVVKNKIISANVVVKQK